MSAELVAKLAALRQQLTGPGSPFEVIDAVVQGRPVKLFKNAAPNLPALVAPGRAFGDKEFVVLRDERWTFARMFGEADALAAQLSQRYGVGKGDRVAIAMRNRPEWMAGFLAAAHLGAVVAPLNSWGRREELMHGIDNAEPKVYVCDKERYQLVADVLTERGILAVVVEGAPAGDKVVAYGDLVKAGAGQTPPAVDLGPDDPALILYTSGTTSKAKGALSTQRAVCQALANFDYQGALSAMTSPEAIQAMMASGLAPTTLMAVPLFHVSGLQFQFLANLRTGRRLVMTWKWEPDEVLRLIAAERCTGFNGSPAMIMQLLTSPAMAGADLSSIGAFGLGGSAVPPKVIELMHGVRPKALSGTGYGLTETNGIGTSSAGSAYLYKPASSGQQSPIIEIAAADESGRLLPPGQTGEIWLRGATVMQGYWRDEAASAAALHDGWFASGDVGYLDDEGFLFIVDRIKDIVNRAGEKISTSEVECCLVEHPAVAEAAAFGVPDETLGEALAVVVRLRPGASATAEQLKDHVAQHLAGFKVPAHITIAVEDFPRSPSGKILKRALRASARP